MRGTEASVRIPAEDSTAFFRLSEVFLLGCGEGGRGPFTRDGVFGDLGAGLVG